MAGEGALESQQAIAARIPYENIAANPARNILNAFALGVEINRRRQQMEQQMERLVLQQQKMEQDRDLKEQEFGLKSQALINMANHRGDMLEIAHEKLDLQDKLGTWGKQMQQAKIDQASGQLENAAKLQTALADNPYRTGSVKAKQYIEDQIKEFGDGSPASRAIINSENRRHDAASRDWEKQKTDAQATLDRMVNNTTSKGGFTKYNWGLPDDVWGTGTGHSGEPTRWIATWKSGPQQGQVAHPDDVNKWKTSDQNKMFDFRTRMGSEYDGIRKQQEIVRSYQNDPDMGAAPVNTKVAQKSDIRDYVKKFNGDVAKAKQAMHDDGFTW